MMFCYGLLQSTSRTSLICELLYFDMGHYKKIAKARIAIWDCCYLLKVPRYALGLRGSTKGKVCGALKIVINDEGGSVIFDGFSYRGSEGYYVTSD
jgi:DNA topoisomerase VI subunit A